MNNEIARHDLSNPESSPRFNGAAFSAAVAGCIAVGFLDYLTGYEVSMSVFYALPVIFAVWFCGKTSGILIALLGVAEWFLSDRASGHHYSHEWIRVWNGMVRFAYLNLIVIGSAAARAQIEKKSAEIKVLRGILPICTECKRVRDEMGHWDGVENYLSEHSEAQPAAKLCPDCARRHHMEQIIPEDHPAQV